MNGVKKYLAALLLLLAVVAFCACGGEKEEEKDSGMVKDFVDKIYAEDFDGAAAYISPEIAESMTEDNLKKIVTDTTGAYGGFSGVNDVVKSNTQYFLDTIGVDASSVDSAIADYDIYYASISLEKGDMGIFFMVSPDDHLLYGLTLCGSESDEGYHSHNGQVHKH